MHRVKPANRSIAANIAATTVDRILEANDLRTAVTIS